MITFDCETDPFCYGFTPEPFLWCAYDGNDYFVTRETHVFINWLMKQKDVCYAHNGGKFDVHYLKKWFNKDEKICIINGRITEVKIGKATVRDSIAILPTALKNLGTGNTNKIAIDIEKLMFHSREKYMSEIIEYCKMDCKVLHEAVSAFINDYGDFLTIGSAALNQLCEIEEIKKPQIQAITDEYYRPYYFGGRVECFQKGIKKTNNDVFVYDINSAYPYAMIHEHPWSEGSLEHKTRIRKRDIKGYNFYTVQCKSIGFFPFRSESGLRFFNDGKVRQYDVTGWELIEYLKTGRRVKHVKQIIFNETRNFKKFVNTFYERKKVAKKGSFERLFVKLILNSSYGKFATEIKKFKDFKMVDGYELSGKHRAYKVENYFDDIDISIISKPSDSGKYINVSVSASITGFVRAMLLRGINDNRSKMVYCDTDCLVTEGMARRITIGDGLGQWDLEKQCDNYAIAGKKLYALWNEGEREDKAKVRSKGVRIGLNEVVSLVEGNTINYKKEAPCFNLNTGCRFINRNVVANVIIE